MNKMRFTGFNKLKDLTLKKNSRRVRDLPIDKDMPPSDRAIRFIFKWARKPMQSHKHNAKWGSKRR